MSKITQTLPTQPAGGSSGGTSTKAIKKTTIKSQIKLPSTKSITWPKAKTILMTLGKEKRAMNPKEISDKSGIGPQTVTRILNYLVNLNFLTRKKSGETIYYDRKLETRNMIHQWIFGADASTDLRALIESQPIPELIKGLVVNEPDGKGTLKGLSEKLRLKLLESDIEIKDDDFFDVTTKFWIDLCVEARLIRAFGDSFELIDFKNPANHSSENEKHEENAIHEEEIETKVPSPDTNTEIKFSEESPAPVEKLLPSLDSENSLNVKLNYNIEAIVNELWSESKLDRFLTHLEHMAEKAVVSMEYNIQIPENQKTDIATNSIKPEVSSDKSTTFDAESNKNKNNSSKSQTILDDLLSKVEMSSES
ncbi:MAG TPA: helix-turn-helix domain-containing protein [Candidatus Deferrimicrobium sp.]|nr:helix-turn-helix domain-containing protein [Candidatus Deferrimicrobium sp.]